MNGTALKNYTTTLTKTVGSDGITVFRAENSQKVGNFEFKKVAAEAKRVGIPMVNKEFHCRGEFKGLHKGRPNEQDLANAAAFARQFM